MTVKGIDYSKQMARERAGFREKIQRNNDANQSTIEGQNRSHEASSKKLQENYKNAKANLEDSFEKTTDNIRQIAVDDVAKKAKVYEDDLLGQQRAFSKERGEELGHFNKRMKDIQKSYADSFSQERSLNKQVQDQQRGLFDEKKVELMNSHENSVKELIGNTIGSSAELRERLMNTNRKIKQDGHDALLEQGRKNSIGRQNSQRAFKKQVDRIAEAKFFEDKRLKTHNQENMDRLKDSHEDAVTGLADNFVKEQKRSKEIRSNEKRMENLRFQDTVSDLTKNAEREKFELKQSLKKNLGDGADSNKHSKEVQADERVHNANVKVGRLREHIDEIKTKFSDDIAQGKKDYDQDLFETKIAQSERIATQGTEFKDRLDKSSLRLQREKQELVDGFRHRLKEKDNKRETQMTAQKSKSKIVFDNLKKADRDQLLATVDENKRAIEAVKQDSQFEMVNFKKAKEKQFANRFEDARSEFGTKLNAQKISADRVQNKMGLDNEGLKQKLYSAVRLERQRATDNITDQKKMFAQQQKEDKIAFHDLMKRRENELHKQISAMQLKNESDKQKTSFENERKISGITNKYETKLAKMTREFNLKSKAKDNNSLREMKRVKAEYEVERERIVSQYENQISQIRQSFTNKINDLRGEYEQS